VCVCVCGVSVSVCVERERTLINIDFKKTTKTFRQRMNATSEVCKD